jgi:hypothetical protein
MEQLFKIICSNDSAIDKKEGLKQIENNMNTGMKYLFNILILFIALLLSSCQLKDGLNTPSVTNSNKNVHYVATMVSSTNSPSPSISYTDQNGGTIQVQVMTLDITQGMNVGQTANLSATCQGIYSPIGQASSASIELQIFVNDTLKAEAHDLKTDPSAAVTASATCSYIIK